MLGCLNRLQEFKRQTCDTILNKKSVGREDGPVRGVLGLQLELIVTGDLQAFNGKYSICKNEKKCYEIKVLSHFVTEVVILVT